MISTTKDHGHAVSCFLSMFMLEILHMEPTHKKSPSPMKMLDIFKANGHQAKCECRTLVLLGCLSVYTVWPHGWKSI